MKKNYEIPESEEITVRVENNCLTTGSGASGEGPIVHGGDDEGGQTEP